MNTNEQKGVALNSSIRKIKIYKQLNYNLQLVLAKNKQS